MSELPTLVRKRGTLKRRVTDFEKLLAKIKDKNPICDADLDILEMKFSNHFDGTLDECKHIQEEILVICEEKDLDEQYDIGTEINDRIDIILLTYKTLIKLHSKHQSISETTPGTSNASVTSGHAINENHIANDTPENSENGRAIGVNNVPVNIINDVRHDNNILSKVKMPIINLPTFNGSAKDWLEWNDLYKALVHNRDDISTTLKHYYLKSS